MQIVYGSVVESKIMLFILRDLTKKEYWKAYTLDMTIDMIFDILKSVESAEENGIDCEELFYYEAVLTEIYSGKVKGNSKSITHV